MVVISILLGIAGFIAWVIAAAYAVRYAKNYAGNKKFRDSLPWAAAGWLRGFDLLAKTTGLFFVFGWTITAVCGMGGFLAFPLIMALPTITAVAVFGWLPAGLLGATAAALERSLVPKVKVIGCGEHGVSLYKMPADESTIKWLTGTPHGHTFLWWTAVNTVAWLLLGAGYLLAQRP